MLRKLLTWGALTLASLLFAAPLSADELLYVYGPNCGACMKWHAEIEPIYGKTQESTLLPLVKVTLDDWRAGKHPQAECRIGQVIGTPTFIHVQDCEEIDRISGYSNDELFWLSLGRMINNAQANN